MTVGIAALVGRPNVGKSTLFNRLVGEPLAVVEDQPGTTRDRNYAEVEWAGRHFVLIDTGGLEDAPATEIGRLVRQQAQIAVNDADVIALCVDVRDGVTADDLAIASLLRRSGKPIVVVAAKADNVDRRLAAAELYALGFDDVIPLSSLHGTGTGDLLQWIVERLPPDQSPPRSEHPRFAIVGRPNVGKSSLLNAIVGEERSIVSDRPGTTRDAIDSDVDHRGRTVTLVDTAGIRRRGRVEVGIEKYSVIRSLRAVNDAHVALLVIDAAEGVTAQDVHLGGYIRQAGRGCVLVANKWDLIEKDSQTARRFDAEVQEHFNFMPWARIVHVSAVTGQRVFRPIDVALEAWERRRARVATAELNRIVRQALNAHPPPSHKGQRLKILYATQAETEPPTFIFFANNPELVHHTYQRFLENQLRAAVDFTGTPIRIRFRGREGAERPDREE